jgi:CHAT domain-containing protein
VKRNRAIRGLLFVAAATLLVTSMGMGQAPNPELEKELNGLFNQGLAARKQGKLKEAVSFFEKAAALAPNVFGADHLNTAAINRTAAGANYAVGRFREAEIQFRRCLEIREAKLPKDDLQVAAVLSDLGITLEQLTKYEESEKLLKRCLAIQEAKLPKNHIDMSASISNLGNLYNSTGRYADAEAHFQRALLIREAHLGKDSIVVAGLLHNLSDVYRLMGEYPKAESYARRSMQVRETKLGKDHLEVSSSLSELGMIHHDMGRIKEAESFHRQALAIREKHLGKNHTSVATALNNLALSCAGNEHYAESELLFRRCLTMRETLLGPDHLAVAGTLDNFAVVLQGLGRSEEAERLYLRAWKIHQARSGKADPQLVHLCNNLSGLYRDQGRFKDAESFLLRGIALEETHQGKNRADASASVGNLALLYTRMNRLPEAQALVLRCLQAREAQFGKDHAKVSVTLCNLGMVYRKLGENEKAEDCYQRSMDIVEAQFGKDSTEFAVLLQNLGQVYQATNRSAEALKLQEQNLAIHQMKLRNIFGFSTESAMHQYVEANSGRLPMMINLAVQAKNDAAATTALTWTFRLRGAVFDSLCRYRQAQQVLPKDDAFQERLARYRSHKEFLANAAVSPPVGMSPERLKQQTAQARQEVEELEKEIRRTLARTAPDVFAQREAVTAEQVQKQLVPDSALIEFVRCPLFDFKSGRWSEQHYLAFVLTAGQNPPRLIDLGLAKDIETSVEDVRKEFADFQDKLKECETPEEAQALEKMQEKQFAKKSAALYARLIAPLRKELGQAAQLYLVPEGSLNRLPFEALVAPDGKYLIEHYRCAYLSSGRDLMRAPGKYATGTVVFAAPDYKLDAEQRLARAEKLLNKKEQVASLRNMPARELRSAGWKNLPGAAAEAKDIQKILHEGTYGPVKSYVGAEALEEVLKAMPAPRVLHLATHGFFLDREPDTSEPAEEGAGAGWTRGRLKRMENPLLRSGIVLAGANTIGDKEATARVDDGWVTAEEIAVLNLQGTELVVLSACQTGLGDIKSGEGVQGLRRAFLYAGAQTLVTSLFEVPDAETRELMKRFYGGLKTGQGKLRALHSAQRAFMDERRQTQGAAHPFFWASFVLVGNAD